MKFCILIFLMLTKTYSIWAQVNPSFDEGNNAYMHQDFTTAIKSYQACLSQGESSSLRFNLGNAYFQNGNIGPAILEYERALQIDPRNKGILTNLEYVRKKSGLAKEKSTFGDTLLQLLTIDTWVWITSFAFWTLIAALLFYKLLRHRFFFYFPASLILCLGTIPLLVAHKHANDAIIIKKETPLLTSPAPTSEVTSSIEEGSRVSVKTEYNGFFFAHLSKKKPLY